MNNLVLCELKKFKSAKIKYSVLVFLIPIILVASMYGINPKYPILEWDHYLTNIQTFLNALVCIAIFGIITVHIFGSEFETKTINILFTYPFNRSKILISKLAAIFIIIITTLLSTFIISVLAGLLIKHESLTSTILLNHFIDFLKMALLQFMLVPIVSSVIILSKNIMVSIIFVIAMTFLSFIIMNTTIGIIFPWSIPVVITPHSFGGRTYTNYTLGKSAISIYFLIFSCISFEKFKYIQ